MKQVKNQSRVLIVVAILLAIQFFSNTGCAVMVPPGGGPRDSLPPSLVLATPRDSALNVTIQKLTLTFDEYIDLKSASENIIISPYPVTMPFYEGKLRNVIIRLKDSLLPNTTYSIDFGNAITDYNEGNVLKNFQFIFSTGNTIDTNELKGNVQLAETGKTDSTMFALLYTKRDDSTVVKEAPVYVTRVNSKGNFQFTNLPTASFYVYAILEADGNKKYTQLSETFAFTDESVFVNDKSKEVQLYAYAAEKEKAKTTPTPPRVIGGVKQLGYVTNIENGVQDIYDSLKLIYQKPLQSFDRKKVKLVIDSATEDTDAVFFNDTIRNQLTVLTKWQFGKPYKLLLEPNYAADTSGLTTTVMDTIAFRVKDEKEFGSVRIRWKELDTTRHPVLLLLNGDKIAGSYPIIGKEWYRKLYNAGTYQLAVLFDTNQNGIWDPGDYFSKPRRQPELVFPLNKEITIKANWDNETEVEFPKQ
jgi:hypothetical protein